MSEHERALSMIQRQNYSVSLAVRDLLAERKRQVEVKGWTPEHDDEHKAGGMACAAAACYALADRTTPFAGLITELWKWTGWASLWFKPRGARNNLVRAGALILAEIERLDRAAKKAEGAS